MATLSANAASVDAEGWTTLDGCDFQIKGGTPGDENSGDYYFADGILHIRSSAPITVRTAPTVDGDGNPILNDEGRPVPSQTSNTIQIDPGVKGELTLAGVDINTGPDYRVETPPLSTLSPTSTIPQTGRPLPMARRSCTPHLSISKLKTEPATRYTPPSSTLRVFDAAKDRFSL